VRVLILGGTGLTGPFLVRRMHGMGHEVTVSPPGEHETNCPQGSGCAPWGTGPTARDLRSPAPTCWSNVGDDRGACRPLPESVPWRARGRPCRRRDLSGDVYRAYGACDAWNPARPVRSPSLKMRPAGIALPVSRLSPTCRPPRCGPVDKGPCRALSVRNPTFQ